MCCEQMTALGFDFSQQNSSNVFVPPSKIRNISAYNFVIVYISHKTQSSERLLSVQLSNIIKSGRKMLSVPVSFFLSFLALSLLLLLL